MKKLFTLLTLIVLTVTLSACGQPEAPATQLILEQEAWAKPVYNWGIYTNGAFRYELRTPTDWETNEIGEFGKEVYFYPKSKTLSDTFFGSVRIIGYVNWRTQYTLEEFYKNQPQNLFEQNFEHEEFTFGGFRAVWFKKVSTIYKDKEIDVIAFDGTDRIIEYYIMDDFNESRLMFNSLGFYGNNTVTPTVK